MYTHHACALRMVTHAQSYRLGLPLFTCSVLKPMYGRRKVAVASCVVDVLLRIGEELEWPPSCLTTRHCYQAPREGCDLHGFLAQQPEAANASINTKSRPSIFIYTRSASVQLFFAPT